MVKTELFQKLSVSDVKANNYLKIKILLTYGPFPWTVTHPFVIYVLIITSSDSLWPWCWLGVVFALVTRCMVRGRVGSCSHALTRECDGIAKRGSIYKVICEHVYYKNCNN